MTDPTIPPAAQPTPYTAAGAAPAKTPVLSIISLVAGIIGVLGTGVLIIPFVGSFLGLPIPLAAVILGFLGKKKEARAKGMWLTGIILGFLGLAAAIIALIGWGVLFAVGGSTGSFDTSDFGY
jgi:hypothetical protein